MPRTWTGTLYTLSDRHHWSFSFTNIVLEYSQQSTVKIQVRWSRIHIHGIIFVVDPLMADD